MAITPDWVTAIVTALVAGGGAGAWIQRQLDARRLAMPIIRTEWLTGPEGFTVKLEVVNRLAEDLEITRAEAKSPFGRYKYAYDAGGSLASSELITSTSPMKLDWIVKAGATAQFSLGITGADTLRWVRLTLSSSARTLRAKRVTLANSSAE